MTEHDSSEAYHKRFISDYYTSILSNLKEWKNNNQDTVILKTIIEDTIYVFFKMNIFGRECDFKHRNSFSDFFLTHPDILDVFFYTVMTTPEPMQENKLAKFALTLIWGTTRLSDELSKYTCKYPGFVKKLLGILDKRKSDSEDTNDKNKDLLHKTISILHSLAKIDENISGLQQLRIASVLRDYLSFPSNSIRIPAILCLADIMTEDECDFVSDNEDVIDIVLNLLVEALKNESRTTSDECGIWFAVDITKGIRSLARNDGNKELLVEKGCLPILLRLAKAENIDEKKIALSTIWSLAFNEHNQEKLVQNNELVKFSFDEYKSGVTDIREQCHGILWTLKERLLSSATYKTIGEYLFKSSITKPTSQAEIRELAAAGPVGHVMLSYQWAHQDVVVRLRDIIRKEGVNVWIDVERMEGSILEAMAKAVESSDIVIMCMSRKYKDSPSCRTEAEYAYKLEKKIIPVMMDSEYKPDGWLGAILGTKLYYDCSRRLSFDESVAQLLKAALKHLQDKNYVDAKTNVTQVYVPVFTQTAKQSEGIHLPKILKVIFNGRKLAVPVGTGYDDFIQNVCKKFQLTPGNLELTTDDDTEVDSDYFPYIDKDAVLKATSSRL